jgi:hypothetical protein
MTMGQVTDFGLHFARCRRFKSFDLGPRPKESKRLASGIGLLFGTASGFDCPSYRGAVGLMVFR